MTDEVGRQNRFSGDLRTVAAKASAERLPSFCPSPALLRPRPPMTSAAPPDLQASVT